MTVSDMFSKKDSYFVLRENHDNFPSGSKRASVIGSIENLELLRVD